MITQRVMSGCKFSDIAYMCGTSVSQIEKTYYHLILKLVFQSTSEQIKVSANMWQVYNDLVMCLIRVISLKRLVIGLMRR